MKSILTRLILLGLSLLVGACSSDSSLEDGSDDYVKYSGQTMGTTYNVTVKGGDSVELKRETDSLLIAFNEEVSTYIPDATISLFNQTEETFALRKSSAPHFFRNLVQSYRLNYLTNGYFDPTVMPLVNYWGFGYAPRDTSHLGDSTIVDSLMQMVGLNRLGWEERSDSLWLKKYDKGMQLDFSASAKGDGVDLVAKFLKRRGYTNFMVEIGGEVYARGENPRGSEWTIGVNRPDPHSAKTDFIQTVQLSNRGLATSGNYRNFFESSGVTYSHTINPKTGWIERNELLSATVIAENVITADAWATALMAMGREEAVHALKKQSDISGFLVYTDGEVMNVFEDSKFLDTQQK
jgi:thiamine biosynthesis lipoprotein